MTRRLIVLALVAVACGDPYLHNNPYDPVYPVTIEITGTDSLFSEGDIGKFFVRVSPAFPDTAIEWEGATPIDHTDSASFTAMQPPLYPLTATYYVGVGIGKIDTVKATAAGLGPAPPTIAYRHTGTKSFIVTQRVVRVLLRCPDEHACDSLSVGEAWSVWADGYDALGHKIVSLTSATANPATGTPVASFAVRDTSIARVTPVGIRVATVAALRSGSTWIVASRDSLRDSLRLTVR